MPVVRSHSLSVGIVGLPNSGKSTLFNALTNAAVPAENYPFCTIDKNLGVVKIPDTRLESMAKMFKCTNIVYSMMTFVDIAGLVKGASKGEGLGNQFLSHIREVDVVMYVLRAFKSENIVHVYDRVDPFDDFKIVESELILKDLESVEKKLGELGKNHRISADKEAMALQDVLKKVQEWLAQGKSVISMTLDDSEKELLAEMWLLTNKPRMFVLNVREGVSESDLSVWVKKFDAERNSESEQIVQADAKMLGEISELEGAELTEYMGLLEGNPTLLDDVILGAYKTLNLLTFYTGSEKECNAWTIRAGATIKEAAGVIHTDLMNSFISADVVNVEDLISVGGWVNAREKGLIKNHNKEYIAKDGDYVVILENSKS